MNHIKIEFIDKLQGQAEKQCTHTALPDPQTQEDIIPSSVSSALKPFSLQSTSSRSWMTETGSPETRRHGDVRKYGYE